MKTKAIFKVKSSQPKLKRSDLMPDDVHKLATEAKKIIETLDRTKKLYGRLDELTLLLKGQDLSSHQLAVIDNFKGKNTVFKPAGVRRWELKRTS